MGPRRRHMWAVRSRWVAGRRPLTSTCGVGVLTVLLLCLAGCGGSEPAGAGAQGVRSATTSSSSPVLRLVAVGDSIPFNSPEDCPGCTGFVERYATALSQATGRKVEVSNLSQHNGLTLPMLLDELDTFREQLTGADAIIVGVAHNSIELNAEKPCGSTFNEATSTLDDWSKVGPACASRTTTTNRPLYDKLFSTIAGWRAGKPTILRTINKYSDWLGWKDAHLTADQEARTVLVHDAWNVMVCDSAEANGFACADIYHAFNGPQGRRPSGGLLAGDYTHPSDEGNAVIARVLTSLGFAPLA